MVAGEHCGRSKEDLQVGGEEVTSSTHGMISLRHPFRHTLLTRGYKTQKSTLFERLVAKARNAKKYCGIGFYSRPRQVNYRLIKI